MRGISFLFLCVLSGVLPAAQQFPYGTLPRLDQNSLVPHGSPDARILDLCHLISSAALNLGPTVYIAKEFSSCAKNKNCRNRRIAKSMRLRPKVYAAYIAD